VLEHASNQVLRMRAGRQRIFANALIFVPIPVADNVEEMMRVAMELSDRDIVFLNELIRVQGTAVRQSGRISRYDAWSTWPNGTWGERLDGEIDSTFSKLEGLGLVSRLGPPNNLNITADVQNRFALLKKGLGFAKFAGAQ
jgi:hypothetical protein